MDIILGNTIRLGLRPTSTTPPDYPTVYNTVIDDGYYNGFPFPLQLSNKTILSLYKKAYNHADLGPLTLARSADGGETWTEEQVTVDGNAIDCAALSFCLLSSGRLLIAYQDDILYTTIKFAYSNNSGISFTSAGTIAAPHAGTFSPSPFKMTVMPSGKIRLVYYCYQAAGLSTVGYIDSINNGLTWVIGNDIYSANADVFPNYRSHETKVLILSNTGVDNTCTMIAVLRGSGGFPLFLYSTDGGTTWINDSTTIYNPGAYNRNFFYLFGGFTNQSPVEIAIHGDTLYYIIGYRQVGNYRLRYTTIPLADALANNFYNYTEPVDVVVFNATTLGSDIDCGYPVEFTDADGKLWVHYYDVSTEPKDPEIAEDRCLIKQWKIAD